MFTPRLISDCPKNWTCSCPVTPGSRAPSRGQTALTFDYLCRVVVFFYWSTEFDYIIIFELRIFNFHIFQLDFSCSFSPYLLLTLGGVNVFMVNCVEVYCMWVIPDCYAVQFCVSINHFRRSNKNITSISFSFFLFHFFEMFAVFMEILF